MPFTNILYPIDFSARCRAIVPHVGAACDRWNASLTLVHFVHIPPLAYGTPDAPVVFDFPLDDVRKSADQGLADFAAREFPGMAVKAVVEEGDPGLCIASFAQESKIDLIMMPTRGRGRFRAALLGSTTAKTIHEATCAVWTDAHCEHGHRDHTAWDTIICAIDTDDEGQRLIRTAADLTRGTKAIVYLAHAVPANFLPSLDADAELVQDEAMQKIVEMQTKAKTYFLVCTAAGPITEVLRHAVQSHRADLVLIGRGVLPRFAGSLRSEVYSIVRNMPCPVLSI
jgi:nucleotide-binding universal stress UspA family protein